MGTILFTADPDGNEIGLYDHEGYVSRIFDDGALHAGGLVVGVDRGTIGYLTGERHPLADPRWRPGHAA